MANTTLRKRRDDDIEALASKACALASVSNPDYADAMERENARSKKKCGDCFNIRDDEVIDEDNVMGLLPGEEFDGDRNGIAPAKRTSQILSNFQDYVSGVGGGGGGARGWEQSRRGHPGAGGRGRRRRTEGGGDDGLPERRRWRRRGRRRR